MITESPFQREERPWGKDDHLYSSGGEFKDVWSNTSLPQVIMGRMGTTSRDNVTANVR